MYFLIFILILILNKSYCDENRPTISELSTSSKINEGKSYRLTCDAYRGGSPITSSWLLNGEKVIPNDNILITQAYDSSILTIKSMSSDYNGEYTCLVRNNFGTDKKSVQVKLNFKPKWVTEPTNIFVKLNSMLIAKCEANAIPSATIKWIKLAQNGDAERTIESDELKFNLTKQDASMWKCLAENKLGKIEKVIQIKYYGK